jgi:hypothetical protein
VNDFEGCNAILIPHCSVALIAVGKLTRKKEAFSKTV